jgi:GNAT superfamily N-acetyltransferase
MDVGPTEDIPSRLEEHLRSWAGAWPSTRDGVIVVPNPHNAYPGWDGDIHPATGVVDAGGRGVLGIPPATYELLGQAEIDVDNLMEEIPELVGRPELRVYRAVFRWSTSPADLADVGTWLDVSHPAVPEWLKPFGDPVLVFLDDDGEYLAGVGLKRHDEAGWEIAVGTRPAAQGRGLARRLVAQAAREVLAQGAVPTYFHDLDNFASAKVAEAAGFPDRGWTAFGTYEPD